MKLDEYLAVSSHILTPKHEAKHEYVTQKRQLVCFVKQLKEPFLGYMSVFSFVF